MFRLSGVGQTKVALTQTTPGTHESRSAELGGTTQVLFSTLVATLIEEDGAKDEIDILALTVLLDDCLTEVYSLPDAVLLIESGSKSPASLDILRVNTERLPVAYGRAVVAVGTVVTHTTGDPIVGRGLSKRRNAEKECEYE